MSTWQWVRWSYSLTFTMEDTWNKIEQITQDCQFCSPLPSFALSLLAPLSLSLSPEDMQFSHKTRWDDPFKNLPYLTRISPLSLLFSAFYEHLAVGTLGLLPRVHHGGHVEQN